jgi:glutamine-rich protein 2
MTSLNHQQALNLQNLVNLALNSPEVGAVNFNILKRFLLELLKTLKLENFELKFDGSDEDSNLMGDILSLKQSTNEKDRLKKLLDATKPINQRIFDIEDKINRFERQFDALDSLPTNLNLIEKTKESFKTDGQQAPLLEVWQYKQLSKRVELIEDGLNKVKFYVFNSNPIKQAFHLLSLLHWYTI